MTSTNNKMFELLDEMGSFHLNKLTLCCFKFALFGNLCIVCPVLFESVQNWTTQRFTIVKKIEYIEANCK